MRRLFVKDIRSLVIKIGTSVLTTNGRFDRRVVKNLVGEIVQFLKRKVPVSIVSSGAIGAGMMILGLKTRPQKMESLQAAAAAGQRYLMQCYEEAFAEHGFSTAQVLLTWDDLSRHQRFLNAKRTLKQIQKWGLVPIINENDTVATEEIRFGDNDRLSGLLSILLQADVLVILSDTNGLYAAEGPVKRRIQIVERTEESLFSHVRESKSSFTVGGMRSKLQAIRMCVSSGIPVFLADGRDESVLTRIFRAEDIGTLFVPHLKRSHARRNWISHFLNHVHSGQKG
ncbi:MAG: glutamate 5-kinase [Candidatus Omnitrophica bacterium]|nr:glutamate 5-kinase [Candidatus Omnitrophota bacterium]